VVCADETPLKVGPATAVEGKVEAKGYLLVACTELYTHFRLGDRSLETFKEFVFTWLQPDAVLVHDRYQNYDSAQLGTREHQLCLVHVLRDLRTAAERHPDAAWPAQLAGELCERIHRPNQARDRGEAVLPDRIKDLGVRGLRAAVTMGLSATEAEDTRPGARKIRLLLEGIREREADFRHFTTDLRIPPASNGWGRSGCQGLDLRFAPLGRMQWGSAATPGRVGDWALPGGVRVPAKASPNASSSVSRIDRVGGAVFGNHMVPDKCRGETAGRGLHSDPGEPGLSLRRVWPGKSSATRFICVSTDC
jgi:hypothetical protein